MDSSRLSSRTGSSGSSMRPDQETRSGIAEGDLELGIEEGGSAGVPEEAAAQGGDLVGQVVERGPARAGVGVRAARARSARSSCQESCTARPTRKRSTSSAGFRSFVQASMRAWKASVSSPGRMTVFARIPCLTALNRARSLPAAVLGPVDFWALRRFASAPSTTARCRSWASDPLRESWIEERVCVGQGDLGKGSLRVVGIGGCVTLCAISIGTFWAVPWTFWEFFWKSGNWRRGFRDSGSDRGVTCRIPGHSEETTLDVTVGCSSSIGRWPGGASVLGEHPTWRLQRPLVHRSRDGGAGAGSRRVRWSARFTDGGSGSRTVAARPRRGRVAAHSRSSISIPPDGKQSEFLPPGTQGPVDLRLVLVDLYLTTPLLLGDRG